MRASKPGIATRKHIALNGPQMLTNQNQKRIRRVIVWLTTAGLLLPLRPATAGDPGTHGNDPTRAGESQSLIRDAVLSPEDALSGIVLTGSGAADAGRTVLARTADGQTRSTITDERGRFLFQGCRGGSYRLGVNGATSLWRVWTCDAAPPIATPGVLLISGDTVARGQRPVSALLTDHPLLPVLFVAAAIAIPLAVHSSQDQPSGS